MSFRLAVFYRFVNGLRRPSRLPGKGVSSRLYAGNIVVSYERDLGAHAWSRRWLGVFQWVFLTGQAAIILGSYSMPSLAENVSTESSSEKDKDIIDKIAEDSMISNEHTSKWRVFTDSGRDYFMQGKIKQAEKFFQSAIEEAKKGFGERDPHVASASNNLAELYRVQKDYENAEPLYVEAINILEEYYGTNDIRVGAALHNLGQFYLGLRKLENARECYERALKIKRRVLGELHTEYADTMYHLGTVLYLQGKEKDSQDLIADSIKILEAAGLGNSFLCLKRMQFLAQMYTKSKQFAEAEILYRKVLHVQESSKGWKTLDSVVARERLALAMQNVGKLREAEELLQRCLDDRKILLPVEHIQNAANELFLARVKILIAQQTLKTDSSQAMTEFDKAQNLLCNSVRVARKALVRSVEKEGKKEPVGPPIKTVKDAQSAMLILLQSINALGSLEILKLEFVDSKETIPVEVDAALHECISSYKEFEAEPSISQSSRIKSEYMSCLKLLLDLRSKGIAVKKGMEKQIKDEIERIEGGDLSRSRKV